LPWEYLYRPDVGPDASLTGFLLFDHRISLVREAPATLSVPSIVQERQRMLFAGALWSYGEDRWGVGIEYIKLAKALESVNEFLSLEFITASGDNLAAALKAPAAILHYSGHTDATQGRGYLVREVNSQGSVPLQTMDSEELANLLHNAQTRLAVFSACNSGRWVFAGPLLRAGLPALIGTQGSVSVQGAAMFSEKLYAALAVGLTLDEAIIGARFQLVRKRWR
jgi:CHAT domain-containing protein